ncbi:unnamed protein product [Brachionus calyciflorus]|uniref:C2H2-type domain-containing protein n=1 Tax=Brachionus calyciflorus TaxID=104777 RepID=A0A814ASW5_9BILA|nr:unnamed protein product [Brachionus calyciflorus]
MENDENQTALNESLSKGNEESVRKSKRLTIVPNKFVGKSGKKSQKESVEWKLGDQCEACDQSKNWFKCKIIQMDETRVKIHFCGWNSRYDKWIDKNSDEIRPEKKTKSKSDNLDELEKNHEKIPNGTFVMSKWIDEAYYPAKVVRFLIKNEMPYYEVKFLDGVRKTIKFSNLRMPNEDELGLFDQTESGKSENLIKEDDQQRRAEAELLLAIQEPVLKLNESPKQEALSENKIEEKNIENPEVVTSVNSEAKNEEKDVKIEENENVVEQGNIRKSLRVKRLRTFTEEIVFDSPASSISYNLASMRREKSPEVVVKKKKVDDKPTEEEKEENRRKVQNYFKSLKLFKSKKMMPHHETKKSEMNDENDDEERKQRKKLKKDKRKLFEELIRNSKIQLEKQQQLIAQQLEEHTLKKSQKKLEKILKKQTNKQMEIYSSDTSINLNVENIEKVNSDVISCTIENCTKTFRKQSLLDYHLKYHHYVDSNKPETTKTPSKKTKPKKVKLENETNEYSYGHSLQSDDETDPYEVIHCKCSNNVNKGFMIQCEICLCWQHGVCERILSNSQVPESYLCWICNEPTNNLKNLKYQSWLKTRMENELKLKSEHAQDNEEINRIKLLNECSKQYYGLNLLMYTLEFQMSIFNQLLSKSHKCELDQMDQSVDNNNNNNNSNNEIEHDDENYEQLDKLSQNIAHLQECLSKQFNEFNSKLDEYETMYPMDENLEMQNFNLEQLYSQLQSIL